MWGCFGKRKKHKPNIRLVRSPSPGCRCSCHEYYNKKVIAACDPPVNYELQSHEGLRPYHPRRSRSPGSRSLERPQSPRVPERPPSFAMDITYVTERIIVLTFPESATSATYRSNLKDVTHMLRYKHGNKYMVFNLSERRYDLSKLNTQVLDFGWPSHLSPPLERLCSICKSLDSWLTSDPQHIAVLHSKGDKGRVGVVIAAYMHYSSICASADQALDRFAMKRFYNDKLIHTMQPSQKRYVHYFAGLLSNGIKMNNSTMYLHHIIIRGIPNFDSKGGCRPFIKIYQGMQAVHTTGVYTATDRSRHVIVTIEPSLQLRGDILVKCYHKMQHPARRVVIFRVQFHTCTTDTERLIFTKDELDEAAVDNRFPDEGRVEFQFSTRPAEYRGNGSVHDAMVPMDSSNDPLVKWDSYENFDSFPEDSPNDLDLTFESDSHTVPHTEGPLDGSLYATVTKKRSPTTAMAPSNPQYNHDNLSDGGHTVSIDSGISSSSGLQGHGQSHSPFGQLQTLTNGSSGMPSPSTVEVEIHRPPDIGSSNKPPPKDEQTQLDELLDGMLREIQSIPDACPNMLSHTITHSVPVANPAVTSTTTATRSTDSSKPKTVMAGITQTYVPPTGIISINGTKHTVLPARTYGKTMTTWTIDSGEEDRPYHTRKMTAPFSYGVTPGSPALRRRRTQSDSYTWTSPRRNDDILAGDVFRDLLSSPEGVRYGEDTSSWLQKQQKKLRARKEGRGWDDRQIKEQQLIAELRITQSKKGVPDGMEDGLLGTDFSSSSREGSPAKTLSYTTPLHINTFNGQPSTVQPSSPYTTAKPPIGKGISAPSSPIIPSRSSSRDATRNRYPQWQTTNRPLTRQKSDISHDRERPFVAAKKAHQLAKEQVSAGDTSPQQVIASSAVYGNIYNYGQPAGGSIPNGHPRAVSPTEVLNSSDSSGLLALMDETPVMKTSASPEPQPISPVPSKLDELEHSLQAMTTHSPKMLTGDRQSPIMYSHSTPAKLEFDGPPSWSPSAVSSSPPGSPTQSGERPPTPAFPVAPHTPYVNQDSPSPSTGLPPKSPTLSRKDRSPSPATIQALRQGLNGPQPISAVMSNGQSSPTVYFGQSRRSSLLSLTEPSEVILHHPVFVKDTSKYWYKPNISREEAISILKDKPPGTFVVRDSNSFPGAFGLALKVATPPPSVQNKTGDMSNELVRHFLIEPTAKGVRLKGCPNEPIFGSLSALVYQHSITPMALPCKLLLPDSDPAGDTTDGQAIDGVNSTAALLAQGAACNVIYLNSVDMESLTGPQAVSKAMTITLAARALFTPTAVHFKVSAQGITLTDNNRRLFFRRHYQVNTISHCGMDPEDRRWSQRSENTDMPVVSSRCFGFIARKPSSKTENQCHLFAELEPEQPASAIVNFVTKVMLSSGGLQNKVNMI